jgi:hypothetical protein
MDSIFTGYEYGIDFIDAGGVEIDSMVFATETAREEFWHELAALDDFAKHADVPAGTERITAWSRKTFRRPIYGVDYGPGSQKHRFGGGYVPRSAYQFGGRS